METYVIVRRGGWRDDADFAEASTRSTAASDAMPGDIAWIRSYVLDEPDGRLGTVCVYRASSPEVIRRHARAAFLPVDEIVRVTTTLIVCGDAATTTE